jgi:hypothetical protein
MQIGHASCTAHTLGCQQPSDAVVGASHWPVFLISSSVKQSIRFMNTARTYMLSYSVELQQNLVDVTDRSMLSLPFDVAHHTYCS